MGSVGGVVVAARLRSCWGPMTCPCRAREPLFRTQVVVWEVATGRAMFELRQHKHGVGSLSFSPDGAPQCSTALH